MTKEKEKTIYDLELHEILVIQTSIGSKIEITKVANGWIYSFDYPGYRQCATVFVPFDNQYQSPTKKNEKKETK